MQALVRHGMGDDDIRLDDVPEPEPAPDEVKIEVRAAGVCGTDIVGHPALRPPVILGHEVAGVIVEVGAACRARKVGERVTSETTKSRCGRCRFCTEGPASLCPSRTGMGSSADGCFAKHVTILESSTHVLPAHVGFEAGSLTELLACATHATVEQAGVGPDEFIVIVGPGPLGLLVARCSAVLGARVVVAGTESDAGRLALASDFGAERTVVVGGQECPPHRNEECDSGGGPADTGWHAHPARGKSRPGQPCHEDLPAVVMAMTDGCGADTVFECSGSPAAVEPSLACLRKRGRYVQAGILHRDIPLDFDDVFFVRELSMVGSHTSNPVSWVLAMNLLAARKVDLEPLITAKLPLADWRRAFDLMRTRAAVKVVLKP